jgi:hypothetical protein
LLYLQRFHCGFPGCEHSAERRVKTDIVIVVAAAGEVAIMWDASSANFQQIVPGEN